MIVVLFGLLGALLLVFLAFPPISSFYGHLSTPLAPLLRAGTNLQFPVEAGVGYLFSAYFLNGSLYAFTGGSIGAIFTDLAAKNMILQRFAEHGIGWGFVLGILVTGMARIRAVYTSSQMINGVLSIAMATLALFTFIVVLDLGAANERMRIVTEISDQYLKKNFANYPLIALLSTAVSAGFVELLIFFRERCGNVNTREIPLSLLRQRIEDHATAEQVFWPKDVMRVTDEEIDTEITAHGLRSVCWITSTAPQTHIRTLQHSLTEWIVANGGEPTSGVRRIMGANVRIVVPDETTYRRIIADCSLLRRVRVMYSAVRVRLLILNGRVAIIHLPLPYNSRKDSEQQFSSQSNFAAILRDKYEIARYETWFDRIWEDMHIDCITEFALRSLSNGDIGRVKVLQSIFSSDTGLTRGEILQACRIGGTNVPDTTLCIYIQELIDAGFVLPHTNGGRYVARRHQNLLHHRDMFRRLVNEDFVSDPMWAIRTHA